MLLLAQVRDRKSALEALVTVMDSPIHTGVRVVRAPRLQHASTCSVPDNVFPTDPMHCIDAQVLA